MMKTFSRDEQRQDLVEYTVLLASVCLGSGALFIGGGNSMQTLQHRKYPIEGAGHVLRLSFKK